MQLAQRTTQRETSMSANVFGLFMLMLIAGAGIPVMAAMNAQVGLQLQSPIAAVVVLCVVALATSALLLTTQSNVNWQLTSVPRWYYLSGLLFILYIGSITFTAPIIGLANAIFFVLLGQLIASAVIDHFGLFNSAPYSFDLKRLAGIVLIVVGIYLAKKTS
jgi:transporter family-2 protein